MNTAKLEKLVWERIRLLLTVSVSIDDLPKERAGDALDFYIVDTASGCCAGKPESLLQEDGTFLLSVNVTNRGDERAYKEGCYALAVCKKDGFFLCYAACSLSKKDRESLTAFFPYQNGRGLKVRIREGKAFLEMQEKPGKPLVRALSAVKYALLQGGYTVLYAVRKSKRKQTILLISEMQERLGSNLLAVKNRLIERGLDKKYRILESARNSRGEHKTSLLSVLAKVACSGIIIADDHLPFLDRIDPGKDCRLIQLWHAGVGFKATGYSRWGHKGAVSPMSSYRRITYAVSTSNLTAPIFSELWGIADERIIPCGMPRMDALLDEDRAKKTREELLRKYPFCNGKKVILFAPTYRGKGRADAHYPLEKLDFVKWKERALASGYVVLVKLHPWAGERGFIPDSCRDVFAEVDPSEDIGGLMLLSDLLVTDYSSDIFEFAALKKPMAFYAFDEEEYARDRGFHRPYRENAPGPVVSDFESLLDVLDAPGDTDAVEAYVKRHFDLLDAGSSDRVIDWLIEDRLPDQYRQPLKAYEKKTAAWKQMVFKT